MTILRCDQCGKEAEEIHALDWYKVVHAGSDYMRRRIADNSEEVAVFCGLWCLWKWSGRAALKPQVPIG